MADSETLADAAAELDPVDNLYEANELLRTESTRLKAMVTSLLSENAHMRGNLAAKDQEIVVAFHERKRLQAQLTAARSAMHEVAVAHRTPAYVAFLARLDASPQEARQQAGIVLPRGDA